MGGNISGARANLTWSFGSALPGRRHEVGWIGRRIVCQMMKTADYLAVTPLFSARALQTRGSRGEWAPRGKGARRPLPLVGKGIPWGEELRNCFCVADKGLLWRKRLQIGLS